MRTRGLAKAAIAHGLYKHAEHANDQYSHMDKACGSEAMI